MSTDKTIEPWKAEYQKWFDKWIENPTSMVPIEDAFRAGWEAHGHDKASSDEQ